MKAIVSCGESTARISGIPYSKGKTVKLLRQGLVCLSGGNGGMWMITERVALVRLLRFLE
jgi:hypothetical protein